MKLSYNWLKEYLHCDLTATEIAEIMTSIGIEVDSVTEIEEVPGGLEGVVVAEVEECMDHPDSDHLHITKINDGSEAPLQVVCGAPNVKAGIKVLFARIGTVLPGDFKIKKSKIRGVESFGMICAEDELGIGNSHDGIMVLDGNACVGTSAKEYLGLSSEIIIEYEITANRVDAASHIGVARDVYAYLKSRDIPCELKLPFTDKKLPDGNSDIKIDDDKLCSKYIGASIKGVKVGDSPEWLKKRIQSMGLNSINNLVDISNYLLFETGQPFHFFDEDKIEGGKVIIRSACDGESLITLDGVERKLTGDDIVIANAKEPMCLAGVLGSEKHGISNLTKNVFVECARFNPANIRKTSKHHGIQTDSSFRFERGTDPLMPDKVIGRALSLITELCGGSIEGVKSVSGARYNKTQIEINYPRMEKFIGKKLGTEVMDKILMGLGYEFISRNGESSVVEVPSYMMDVTRECDVVEEILRIYGYDNVELPDSMRISVSPTKFPNPEHLRTYLSNFLAANGFIEIMNNSLTKGERYDSLKTYPREKCVNIVNPLSGDLNVLRQSLLPGGLEVLAYNINRQINSLCIFEYGTVYCCDGAVEKLDSYKEHTSISMLMTGVSEKTWRNGGQKSSYFLLKGYLELIFKRFGIDIYSLEAEEAPSDIFREGLLLKVPGSGEVLAVMGTISSSLLKSHDVRQQVYAAEINWETLLSQISKIKVLFKELPKYPEVKRDLALLLDESVCYADLRKSAVRVGKKLLKSVSLIDVYRGDKIPAGKKQYALGFVFRDPEKTLTDVEIEKIVSKLLSAFSNEFGAVLR